MVAEYSGWPTWSTRSPSGVSSWTSSAPPSPMVSGTGAVSAATAAAWAACSGIATSLSLTGAPYFAEPAGITAGSPRAIDAWRGRRPWNAPYGRDSRTRVAALTGLASTPYLQDARESQIADGPALAEPCCPVVTSCRQEPLFAAFACSDPSTVSVLGVLWAVWAVFTDVTDVSSVGDFGDFRDFRSSGSGAGAIVARVSSVYITAGATITSAAA